MSEKKPTSYFSEDTVRNEMTFRKLFAKIWPYLWAHKRGVITVVITVICFVVVGRLLPMIFGYAIDEGIRKENLQLIYWVACAYLVLEVMRAGLSFVQSYSMQKLANRTLFEIRERLISHIQRLPISYFDKNPIGRTVTRVTNDISSLGELFTQGFSAIFVNTVEMLSILVALSFISVRLTLMTVLVAPILLWISLIISRRIRALYREAKRKLATINAFTAESLNGMRILQLYGRVSDRKSAFAELSENYRDIQLHTVRLFALLWPILEAFNVATIATALFFGAMFREPLSLTVGSLSAFILLLQGFFRPLRVILERYNQLQNSLASADRVFSMLEEKQEDSEGQALPNHRLSGHLRIENLSFRYGANNPYALKNVSLDIPAGSSVAIVGRTGSGKTTLISLLQKFYSIEEGEIFIDGIPLSRLAPHEIRQRVGVVQQDNFIFRGTIQSNISLDHPEISREQVELAAKRANCQHLIERHPEGLLAKVEERGANLSVGERQLVAFARVLAFDPDVLILDEATANIDSVNEALIQEATRTVTQGRTSVIIAHRLSTILHCDQIVLLDKGQIVEVGPHRELMARKGRYYELYHAQFSKARQEHTDLLSL